MLKSIEGIRLFIKILTLKNLIRTVCVCVFYQIRLAATKQPITFQWILCDLCDITCF